MCAGEENKKFYGSINFVFMILCLYEQQKMLFLWHKNLKNKLEKARRKEVVDDKVQIVLSIRWKKRRMKI